MGQPDQSAPVRPLVVPEIVTLPAGVDAVTARRLGTALMATFGPGVEVVIVDMSRTVSCHAVWAGQLLAADRLAAALGVELRVVTSQAVLTTQQLADAEHTLPIYPTMTAALTGALQPGTWAGRSAAAPADSNQIRVLSCGRLYMVMAPAKVGAENAQEFWVALADGCARHAVTIADMTGTVVCGHDAVTALLMTLRCTDTSGGELWLAASAAVDRLVSATPISGAFPRFPGLRDALATLPARRPDLV